MTNSVATSHAKGKFAKGIRIAVCAVTSEKMTGMAAKIANAMVFDEV